MIWSSKSEKERVAIRRVLVVVHRELTQLQRDRDEPEHKKDPLDRALLITRGAINSLGLGRIEPADEEKTHGDDFIDYGELP